MPKPITESLATHIITVYDTMEERSETFDDIQIYTGALSNLIRELGISMTFYKPIFRALYDGGYCALGDRGGRDKPSTVILLGRPEKDELKDLTAVDGYPIVSLVARVETVETSLGGLFVVGALQELEQRLVSVEQKLKERGSTSGKTKK